MALSFELARLAGAYDYKTWSRNLVGRFWWLVAGARGPGGSPPPFLIHAAGIGSGAGPTSRTGSRQSSVRTRCRTTISSPQSPQQECSNVPLGRAGATASSRVGVRRCSTGHYRRRSSAMRRSQGTSRLRQRSAIASGSYRVFEFSTRKVDRRVPSCWQRSETEPRNVWKVSHLGRVRV